MKIALATLLTTLIGVVNFAFFVFCYNRLATPFIDEPQRVENADFIMQYATIGFVAIAAVSMTTAYFLFKR